MNFKTKDDTYLAHTYSRFPVYLKEGKGCYLYDHDGKEYVDFTSGIGVNSLGYGNSEWVEAVTYQASHLAHCSNLFYSDPMMDLAKTLCEKSGAKKVFFANSGAEANEGCIKVARKYANHKYAGKRNEIITLFNSFHGRTITTLSATGQDHFHHDFMPFTEGFVYADAHDIDDLKSKVTDKTLAIMFETVQGEGGVLPLESEYMQEIQKICDENDILMIVDEVQIGIGRSGHLFSYEHYGLHPDLVSCAKGLGGGLPIGGVLMFDKTCDVLNYGDHGTTFGGNPVSCAGANVVMKHMNDELYQEIQVKSAYLKERMSNMPHVKKVNGLGFMLGVEFDGLKAVDVVKACIDKGALFLTAKNNLRLLPPLVIQQSEIEKGMDILEDVLSNMEVA